MRPYLLSFFLAILLLSVFKYIYIYDSYTVALSFLLFLLLVYSF